VGNGPALRHHDAPGHGPVEPHPDLAGTGVLNQEYAAGIRDAENWRFTRDVFGEEAAAAQEYDDYLRFGDGY
jgi:hypothetical protein